MAQLDREADKHDRAEAEQRKQNRRYNSNTFVFHNLGALTGRLDFEVMKNLDFDLLRWRRIASTLATKSKDRKPMVTQSVGISGARSSGSSTSPLVRRVEKPTES